MFDNTATDCELVAVQHYFSLTDEQAASDGYHQSPMVVLGERVSTWMAW